MTRTAVLGTGTMGAGMARSLLREGHDVRVWNRTRAKAEAVAGAAVAGSPAEAVDGAEVVVVMVFDVDAVLAVLGEARDRIGADAVVVQCSTVGPEGAARIDAYARENGLRVLDSPVLGTRKPAEEGSLAMLVSGDPALCEVARPVLEAVGAKIVWAGDRPGAASGLKLSCNAFIASVTAAVAQSLELTSALGLDPRLFLQAIEGGAVDTQYAHIKGPAMLAGRTGEVSFALDGLRKEIDLAVVAAEATGVPTRLLDALRDLYATAAELGHGGDDIGAVFSAFARPEPG